MSPQSSTMESCSQFENLPTEVLVQILTHMTDIHCLWSLLTSSPASYRVFNRYSDEIFWPAISDSIIPPQSQDIIRFVISLRAGCCRETSLEDIIRKVGDREVGIVLGRGEQSGYQFPAMDPTKKPSLSVLRTVVGIAGQVHCLSRSCIEYYLGRLRDRRSEIWVDWWPRGDRSTSGPVSGSSRVAEDETYDDDRVSMVPSWVEEQRIIRAFWRVQLILELRLAARNEMVRCSPREIQDIHDVAIESLYYSSTSNLRAAYHEVMTALEFLRGGASSDASPDPKHHLPAPTWPKGDMTPSTVRVPSTNAMRRSSLVLPTDGLWIVDSMSRGAHSPIKYAGFEPYRCMGFAIWDRDRLADMHMASPPGHGRVTGLGSYFSAWLRLLSASDMARAEEKMREAENGGGRLEPLQPMMQDNAS